MTIDREDECYLPVALLLSAAQRDMLDEALGHVPLDRWEHSIDTYANAHSLAASVRAKLRVALWFWNGAVPLLTEDLVTFDMDNRERFVIALRAHLDLPSKARVVMVLPLTDRNLGRAA